MTGIKLLQMIGVKLLQTTGVKVLQTHNPIKIMDSITKITVKEETIKLKDNNLTKMEQISPTRINNNIIKMEEVNKIKMEEISVMYQKKMNLNGNQVMTTKKILAHQEFKIHGQITKALKDKNNIKQNHKWDTEITDLINIKVNNLITKTANLEIRLLI